MRRERYVEVRCVMIRDYVLGVARLVVSRFGVFYGYILGVARPVCRDSVVGSAFIADARISPRLGFSFVRGGGRRRRIEWDVRFRGALLFFMNLFRNGRLFPALLWRRRAESGVDDQMECWKMEAVVGTK
jgi:hypothetical protein